MSGPLEENIVILAAKDAEMQAHHMEAAIDRCLQCVPESGERKHPKVGAVAVRDGEIIETAYRGELSPGEHAEFTLFRKLNLIIPTGEGGWLINPDRPIDCGAVDLYTTLEPCTSRNLPKVACAQRIVDLGFKRVFIGMYDPNPRIYCSGETLLDDAGIEVVLFPNELRERLNEINRSFADQFKRNPADSGVGVFSVEVSREYIIGSDDREFRISFSGCGEDSLYVYGGRLLELRRARKPELEKITDARHYLIAKDHVPLKIGETLILKNANDYFAAMQLTEVIKRGRQRNLLDVAALRFCILPDKASNFSTASW